MTGINKNYDVFLSHNKSDKYFVEEIAKQLEADGLKPFLDEWHLVPGQPMQEGLEQALDASKTCAVFLGANEMGGWENEEMRSALAKRVENKDFSVIPVLLPNVELPNKSKLPKFLKRLVWVEFNSLDDKNALHKLKSGIYGRSPGSSLSSTGEVTVNPYQGLLYFDQEHAAYFEGRGSFIQQLVSNLKENDKESRFLAVIGSSGSGKSSVVRAGLLPELKRGALEQSQDWLVLVMTPTAHPVSELAAQLVATLYPKDSTKSQKALDLQDLFSKDTQGRGLNSEVRQAFMGGSPKQRLLIFVDQFEELFTLCKDEAERVAFLNTLLYAADIATGQCIVVITMRADFYTQASIYPNLADHISEKQLTLTPMTEEEVREAIVLPAQKVGLSFEDGLVDQIISDFMGEPGALPLLQHTLYELWYKQEKATLTHTAYQEIGGVKGAIAKRAEEEYLALSHEQQQVAKRVLLRLVQPGEGSEDTRRRASLSELYTEQQNKEAVDTVIKRLTDTRLVTSNIDETNNTEQLDVAHEALIRGWPTLRKWIDEDRESLKLHRRLGEQVQEWLLNDKDDAYLYRSGLLTTAQEWAEQNPNELSQTEQAFIEASSTLEIQQELKELEDAKKLADEAEARRQAEEELRLEAEQRSIDQQKSTRKFRWLSGILALVGVLALGAAGLFFSAQIEAQKQTEIAEHERDKSEQISRESTARLYAGQVNFIDSQNIRLLQAVEAVNATKSDAKVIPAAYDRLRGLLENQPKTFSTLAIKNGVVSVVFGPDKKTILALTSTGDILGWNKNNPTDEPKMLGQNFKNNTQLFFSPDGSFFVAINLDNIVQLWRIDKNNLGDSQSIKLKGHEGNMWRSPGVTAAAFNFNGTKLATGGFDSKIHIWNLTTIDWESGLQSGDSIMLDPISMSKHRNMFRYNRNGIKNLIFSPNGNMLVSEIAQGIPKGFLHLWYLDAEVTNAIELTTTREDSTNSFFSFDSKKFVVIGGGQLKIWNIPETQSDITLIEPTLVRSAANGTVVKETQEVIIAYNGNLEKFGSFDLASEPIQFSMTNNMGSILKVSPNNKYLVVSDTEANLMVWDIENLFELEPIILVGHESDIKDSSFNYQESVLVSIDDSVARFWNLTEVIEEPEIIGSEIFGSIFYNKNGALVEAIDKSKSLGDHVITINDEIPIDQEEVIESLVKCPAYYIEPTFNLSSKLHHSRDSDSKLVACISNYNSINLWNLDGEKEIPVELTIDSSMILTSISLNGNYLAAGAFSNSRSHEKLSIFIWDLQNFNLQSKSILNDYHNPRLRDLVIHPENFYVAFAVGESWDKNEGLLQLWNFSAENNSPIALDHHQSTNVIAFSPDGKIVASGGDGFVRITNLNTPNIEPIQLIGHTGVITALAISNDNNYVAVGSEDNNIMIWNLDNYTDDPLVLRGHESEVITLAFDGIDNTIVSGSNDGTIRTWRFDIQDLIDIACNFAGRNMSIDEWNRYMISDKYHKTCTKFPNGAGIEE